MYSGDRTLVGEAAVGPDGTIYVRTPAPTGPKPDDMGWFIRRFTREGKLVPFEAGESILTTPKDYRYYGWGEHAHATFFAVGPDGRMYVVAYASRDGTTCRLDVYGADGRLAVPGFLAMSWTGGCVRIDRFGRLYAADSVRPKDRRFPDFYPADPRKQFLRWYGTVFRFDAAGGGVAPAEPDAATYLVGVRDRVGMPANMKGAVWGFYGISPMVMTAHCRCVLAAFDVDDWGRVFVPDALGYCVTVLDSAGNLLGRFGSYGNCDARGAGSAVPEPAIPLWSPERVAVLDGDAFVADNNNGRIVQVRLTAGATEEVPVP